MRAPWVTSRYVCASGTLPTPALMMATPMPGTRASSGGVVPRGTTAIAMCCGAALAAGAPAPSNVPTTIAVVTSRTFAKFTFFKLDPAWQRREPTARAEDKREFLAACEDFSQDRSLRAYSTVGTRGDA